MVSRRWSLEGGLLRVVSCQFPQYVLCAPPASVQRVRLNTSLRDKGRRWGVGWCGRGGDGGGGIGGGRLGSGGGNRMSVHVLPVVG